MDYLSAKQVGETWGISSRRVTVLCKGGRVPGAQLVAGGWIIPNNVKKPEDARVKNRKYIK